MAELSSDFKESVRQATDLVALIGETVALRPLHGGREFTGLCPFHDDHNPSLHVYPDRQTFRCWVCNEGGDCFTFVMSEGKIGFREALEILARRAGLEMPKSHKIASGPSEGDKAKLFEALLWAQGQFHETLLKAPEAQRARDYVAGRGFTPETVAKFKLGYHPDDWDWLVSRSRGKFAPEQLEAAKLIGKRQNGPGYYDNFVNRLLFPIWNERGQPVAFGGRILPGDDDSHGKYWNSPESPVFHKSRMVYALNHAREGIKQAECVVVTEGYTDCIAAHQAGVANVVGTLGTALTDQHVATVKRFARRVVLVYDGDQAGQDAANRAVEKFLSQDVDLRILTLPGDQDPADYLAAEGGDAFRNLVEQAPEAWGYKFHAVRRKHGVDSLDARQRVLDEMLDVLVQVPRMSENVREGMLLTNLSQRLGIAEQQVRDRFRELRTQTSQRRVSPRHEQPRQPHVEIERLLQGKATTEDRYELPVLEALFALPSALSFLQAELPPGDFQNRAIRRLYEIGLSFAQRSETPSFERFLGAVEHPDLKRLAVWVDDQARAKGVHVQLQEVEADGGCPLFLRRSISNLKWRREEQAHQQAAVKLTAAGDGPRGLDAEAEALLRRASEFHQKRATRKTIG